MERRHIRRERIVERIRRSANRRIALVVAAAGFGKSIAVRESLEPGDGDTYYRVSRDANTLLAFVRGLTDTLEGSVPGAHLSLAIAYERAIQSPAPASELARWLGEHLREAATLRIVIDDLHNATATEIPEFIRVSIEAAPEQIRWLLATRDASALPVASWLAHNACDIPIGEDDLRFTFGEVPDDIVRLTGGWPAAVGLAFALDGPLPEQGDTPLATYRELARRVLDAMPEPGRTALVTSAVFADGPFDSLFRDFLLERLHSAGPDVERDALVAAAAACEQNGDVRSAMTFYQRTNAPDDVSRLLAGNGVALMDGGFADVVDAAIANLDRNEFDGGPAIMLLKAIRDARFARFDSAEAWFQLAIAATDDDDLRLRIVHRYALDLLRRGRVDAIDVLEPAVRSARSEHEFLPLLNATLATAYALVDRFADARTAIASATDRLSPDLPAALRTRAYHQAAYVALRCGDIPEARRYAERVLDIAVPNGFYDLAARAHSILYEIAHAWDADPKRALAHVELVAAYGVKAGDTHIRQWALLTAYFIEAERGNATMMGTIERALNAPEVLQTTEETRATLLPGQALRATWSGDFGRAFRLVAGSAETLVSADRRALRWAEIALFAAAAGSLTEARAAAAAAQGELAAGQRGKHGAQGAAYLLVALSLLDQPMTWVTVRGLMHDDARHTPEQLFLRAADALHNHWFAHRDHDAVLTALNALREHDFGGVAAMLESLPAYPAAMQTLP